MTTPIHDAGVFDRVLIRPVGPADPLHGALFHLWWSAPAQGERVVQVYANGRLHDTTADPAQRDLWLHFPAGRPQRVTLYAVSPADAYTPRQLSGFTNDGPSDVASLVVLRDPAAPVESVVGVAVDGQPAEAAPLFGADSSRLGFGSVFGEGGFGIDAAAGPGLGRGELGLGPLGSDGEAWRWRRDDLAAGPHTLIVTHTDTAGRTLAPDETVPTTIDRLPSPPTNFSLRDDFTLVWD